MSTTRRILERLAVHHISQRMAWKLLKGIFLYYPMVVHMVSKSLILFLTILQMFPSLPFARLGGECRLTHYVSVFAKPLLEVIQHSLSSYWHSFFKPYIFANFFLHINRAFPWSSSFVACSSCHRCLWILF